MTQLLNRLSDRLAGLVLRPVDAGACVPEQGDCCYCAFNVRYTFDCNGVCRKTSVKCPYTGDCF
jgi:hypothetical protein